MLLGIDLGTSSVKAVVVDPETLHIVGQPAGREYATRIDGPAAEQNPEDWWQAAVATVRETVTEPDQIQAIGLAGQMHGFVNLDADNQPLRPAIIWKDSRSREYVARLDDWRGAPGPPAAGFMATTLMWMADHEPDTLAATQTVILPKDYLRLRLTGTVGTDVSDAAATWLLDVTTGIWSDMLIERCGVERRYLPPVSPSYEVVGRLQAEAAAELGLKPGIPVVAGSADQPAQALGHGLCDTGSVLVTVGTGGQIFAPLTAPALDSRYYVLNHAMPDRWYILAAILSAGDSLKWLRGVVGKSYAELSALAAQVALGSDGLVFLPYLAGERAPHNDASASGVFVGLRHHHSAGHLAHAIMEGVAFALRECYDLIEGEMSLLLLSGGITGSPVWSQIMADVFDQPFGVDTSGRSAVASGVGAAIIAGVGTGVYTSFSDACERIPAPTHIITPENKAAYRDLYAIYTSLYPALKTQMHHLV
jgi:xylulokinase